MIKKSRSVSVWAGKKIRTHNISKRAQHIALSSIKGMSILAHELKEKTGNDIISFGQGIPYLDTPDYIKAGIRKALAQISTAQYTLQPGIPELRTLIAKHLEQSKKIPDVQPQGEIMVTTGCQEAVACALASTIDEEDEVLLFSPGFPSHWEQTIQFGGVPKFVSLLESQGWHVAMNEFKKRITKKTKAILLSNPSNPTGLVFNEKEIRDLARLAQEHDLIIITDETYDFLTYEGRKHISPASLPKMRKRVIVCGSFSKRYALTGYRIGYAFADEGIIEHMLKMHDALTICAPSISQKAAITALKGLQNSVTKFIAAFTHNRELMCKKLDEMSKFLEYHKPMGAYYIFPKVKLPRIPSFELALRILQEAYLIVVPGAAFGPSGEGHIRLTFACAPKVIEEGCRRFINWFRTYAR